MLTEILSISSVLLGIYLLLIFLKQAEFSKPHQDLTQYHMGSFSEDNILNHSLSIRGYLSPVNSKNRKIIAQKTSFSLANKINYNEISKGVARDFQKYLNEYYQIKTKGIYEQNFYKSLDLAEERFQTCKQHVQDSFDKQSFLNSWDKFTTSQKKYDQLKDILKQRIQRKQNQEKKISYLILDTNYTDSQEYDKNITSQINDLHTKLEQINSKKIIILTQKVPLQTYIASNKTKLQADETLLDQCLKNMKIITFCNQLNKEVNSIKLTFSKQDIQTKIQRKKFIIDSFNNAIRNAQKLGDKQMIQLSRQSLVKNEQQLSLLIGSIQNFETFQQSYCSKCSDQKIQELRVQIQRTKVTITEHRQEHYRLVSDQDKLTKQVADISVKMSRLQEQRDFNMNSNICVTPECLQQRSQDIRQRGRVLSQMKKEVIDYKFDIQQHKVNHNKLNTQLNEWNESFNNIVSCLYKKQYYQALRDRKPQYNKNQVMKIEMVKLKLIKKLQALGS